MSDRNAILVPDLRASASAPDARRLIAVVGLAATLIATAILLAGPDLARRGLVAAGAALIAVAVSMAVRTWADRRARNTAKSVLAALIERDATPGFVTDSDGALHARNAAARSRFCLEDAETLPGLLRTVFANPSAVLFRLQARASASGAASEVASTRDGRMRLSVHLLGDSGFLWRIEDLPDRSKAGWDALPVPVITVARSGAILKMNASARDVVGHKAKSLDRLFADLPLRDGRCHMLSTRDGPRSVLVKENPVAAGRREILLVPIEGATFAPDHGFDRLPVPMIKVAPTGELLRINRSGADLLGPDVAVGMRLGQAMHGLGRPISDWLSDAVESQQVQKSEFLRLARKDRETFVQVTLNPVSENGAAVILAVLSDATELKTLEAQFVQSQKMQAIGQLAGGIAHDFNNLLTAISGHCDLLLLRHDRDDPDYGDLVQIDQNANRAAALVSQLLAFSRKQTLRPELLDLRDTLSDLTHLLNRLVGEKVTLTLSHDPILRPIRADKRQLEQVLMNLVVNARDAMPQGGEIRIATEVVTLQDPLLRDRAAVPAGDYVTVKVCDEGTGIAPDRLQKVFEPFYTTKRTGEGTGLGLSTAYGIVKQTGGFIFVDSVAGRGTEFTLYFPAEAEGLDTAALPADAAPKPAPPRHGDGVVLLVEDEPPVRAFASRALRLRGYTVLEAESGEAALQMLADPGLAVDVFVTDVVMPGLDGPSWVRRALDTRPNVRVVFVSGYAEGAFGEADTKIANSVFLPKPFSLNQLTETVHQQLT